MQPLKNHRRDGGYAKDYGQILEEGVGIHAAESIPSWPAIKKRLPGSGSLFHE
jgi:hypothetical protein